MKIAKIMALWAALFGRAWAAELNEDDAGDCVPLNKEQQPMNLKIIYLFYSGLTLNQYGVASPCRTICTVCGFVALS